VRFPPIVHTLSFIYEENWAGEGASATAFPFFFAYSRIELKTKNILSFYLD
jgi:hypothetical protein